MKAEHRKELQTNTLADFLGRTVQTARTGGGLSWPKVIIAIVLIVVLFIGFLVWRNWGKADSEAWLRVALNDELSLQALARERGDTPQGQAARFTLGFDALWRAIYLIKVAPADQVQTQLLAVYRHFLQLADECKDSPERAAEARYHAATAMEALAAFDVKKLDESKLLFESVTSDELGATAYGAMAKKRLEAYNSDFANLTKFYREFRAGVRFGG